MQNSKFKYGDILVPIDEQMRKIEGWLVIDDKIEDEYYVHAMTRVKKYLGTEILVANVPLNYLEKYYEKVNPIQFRFVHLLYSL